jgi:hypothetical protein
LTDMQQGMFDLDETLFKATIPAALSSMSPLPPGSVRDDPFVKEDPRRRWIIAHAGQEVRIVEREGEHFRAIAADGTTGHLTVHEYELLPGTEELPQDPPDNRRLYLGDNHGTRRRPPTS